MTEPPASPPSRSARLKEWGDAATALLKPTLLVLAALLVVAISATAIRRDRHNRAVAVEIEPEAERSLRSLGADLDLRQSLIDALNARLLGVQQIIRLDGAGPITGAIPEDVSFKPFGLDASTLEIVQIARQLFGTPPPPSVRVELICAPAACTAAGTSKVTLLITLQDASGSRRIYSRVPLANPALRRALRQAMDQAADLLLERTEPAIASDYYLNRSGQRSFRDEVRSDLVRAEGAALAVHGTGMERCLANMIIGPALFRRGEQIAGIAAENRAARDNSRTCQVNALTNIALLLEWGAHCETSPSLRDDSYAQGSAALEKLHAIRPSEVDALTYYRIPLIQLQYEILRIFREPADDQLRLASCSNRLATATTQLQDLPKRIAIILQETVQRLPAALGLIYADDVFEQLRLILKEGMSRHDLVSRYQTAGVILDALQAYKMTSPFPRPLFTTEAWLEMGRAEVLLAAEHLPPAERLAVLRATAAADATQEDTDNRLDEAAYHALNAALVARENALVSVPASLVQSISDITLRTEIGDVLYVLGDSLNAGSNWARALDAYAEEDEPTDDLLPASGAVARWAALKVSSGACRSGAAVDRDWEKGWLRFGTGSHNVCSLLQPDQPSGALAMLDVFRPFVSDAMKQCVMPLEPSSTTERLRFIHCEDQNSRLPDKLTGRDADEQIEQAIGH